MAKSGGSRDKAPRMAEEESEKRRKAFQPDTNKGRIGALAITGAPKPGDIRNIEGRQMQYAETRGMAGSKGNFGWIPVNTGRAPTETSMAASPAAAMPDEPVNLGRVAQPNTFGKEPPPANPEELEQRVQRNSSFLQSPETRAALLQFGISLMATAGRGNIGSNIGAALGGGIQAAGRVRLNEEAAEKELREAQLAERRMLVDEGQLELSEFKLGMEVADKQKELARQERRRKLYGALAGDPKDTENMVKLNDSSLLDMAGELAAEGDNDGAKTAIDLANARRLGTSTDDIVEWRQAVQDGSFDGGFAEWSMSKTRAGAMNISTQVGSKLDPNIMKQAIDDAKAADDLGSQSQELGIALEIAKKTPTGFTTPWTLPIRSALLDAGFVWNEEDEENITLQQVLESQSNQLALRMRNPDSGFGLTGNTSNQDIKFLLNTTANLGRTPEANIAALVIMQAKQRRKADIARARAEYAFDNETLKGWGKVAEEKFTGEDAPSIFTEEEMTFLDSLSNPERPLPTGDRTVDETPAPGEDIEVPELPPDNLSDEDKQNWFHYDAEMKRYLMRGGQ